MYYEEIAPFLNIYLETLNQSKISEALKYSIEGGKCIRSFIVKHIIETINPNNLSWEPIVALELIQASSLIIDDLPCMDNDEIRRGKPSTFKKFGQNESILTSFFMVTESIRILNSRIFEYKFENEEVKKAMKFLTDEWCELLGKNLVVGQMIDLKLVEYNEYEEIFNITSSEKEEINDALVRYKTCSLFSFAFVVGCIFSDKTIFLKDYREMGYYFGVMFQLMDDYVDKETDDVFVNYILAKGESIAREKYIEAKNKLLELLSKNDINTNKFNELIALIDSKFINLPES